MFVYYHDVELFLLTYVVSQQFKSVAHFSRTLFNMGNHVDGPWKCLSCSKDTPLNFNNRTIVVRQRISQHVEGICKCRHLQHQDETGSSSK